MIRPPPISTRTDPPCPYTTRFRSEAGGSGGPGGECGAAALEKAAAARMAGIGHDGIPFMMMSEAGLARALHAAAHLLLAEFLQQGGGVLQGLRSEEHTSELQSLMRISYAVFCLKKKKK